MAIKVRATALGHYGNKLREAGQEFEVQSEKHLSKRWMERVDGKKIISKDVSDDPIAKVKPEQAPKEDSKEESPSKKIDSDVI